MSIINSTLRHFTLCFVNDKSFVVSFLSRSYKVVCLLLFRHCIILVIDTHASFWIIYNSLASYHPSLVFLHSIWILFFILLFLALSVSLWCLFYQLIYLYLIQSICLHFCNANNVSIYLFILSIIFIYNPIYYTYLVLHSLRT